MDALVQEFDDLQPQQRAIAEAMRADPRLNYLINVQTSFALDPVEASLLFDGSIVVPRSGLWYSKKHLPVVIHYYVMGGGEDGG